MNPSPTDDPVTIVGRKAAEGSRPLPTMQTVKGDTTARLRAGHARPLRTAVSGIGGSGALGGAQRAPPVCFANTLLRLIAPRGNHCALPSFAALNCGPTRTTPHRIRNSGTFLCYFLLVTKESRSSREAAVTVSPAADSPQSRRTSARSRTARWQRASRPGSANRPGR